MYEELVKKLRRCGKGLCTEDCPDWTKENLYHTCQDEVVFEAADAIEERDKAAFTLQHEMMAEAESHIALVERLNKQIEELQKNVAYWQAQLTKSMCGETLAELEKPRWVSVTERLPEDGSLVGKLIADSDGNIRIASQCAEITLSGGKTVYTDLIDLVSLLAEDTPTTEWEDCTHITH